VTPPTVLLDQPFLEALIDPAFDNHAAARHCYQRLLDEYEPNKIRLRARADHLAAVDRQHHRDLLAPVETIHVARQFRRQAERLDGDYSPDVAITLVVMRRESIERIATFNEVFDTIEVTVER
jgi:predicted nucleic acid-binding protein